MAIDTEGDFRNALYVPKDQFEIPRTIASCVIVSSQGDSDKEVAFRAQQIHGQSYVEYGYFDKSGLDPDGRLLPELDGTREREDTNFLVTYLIAKPADGSVADAQATMRLLGISRDGTVDDLPTYKYYKGGFSDTVLQRIHLAVTAHGPENIREVAALAVEGKNHIGSYELMRAAIQNAVIKKSETGEEELFIASLTEVSLRPVLDFCGGHAAETIGDCVVIFSDEPKARRNLLVWPVLIEPCKIIDGLEEDIRSAKSEEECERLIARFLFLTDGLQPQHMSEAAQYARSCLLAE